jgi:hypothetical protein
LAHFVPPVTTAEGVLGLDFFRGLSLSMDFRSALVTLR